MSRTLIALAVFLMSALPSMAQEAECLAKGWIYKDGICYTPIRVTVTAPQYGRIKQKMPMAFPGLSDPPIDCGYGSPGICTTRILKGNSLLFEALGHLGTWGGTCEPSGTHCLFNAIQSDLSFAPKFWPPLQLGAHFMPRLAGTESSIHYNGGGKALSLDTGFNYWAFGVVGASGAVTSGSQQMLRTNLLGGVNTAAAEGPGYPTAIAIDPNTTWRIINADPNAPFITYGSKVAFQNPKTNLYIAAGSGTQLVMSGTPTWWEIWLYEGDRPKY